MRKLTLAVALAALVPLAFTSIPAEATPVQGGSQIGNTGGDSANTFAVFGGTTASLGDSTPGTDDPDAFVGVLSTLWSMAQFSNGPSDPGPEQINQPSQVPEPGMLALLGAGLVGLAVLRRRKTA